MTEIDINSVLIVVKMLQEEFGTCHVKTINDKLIVYDHNDKVSLLSGEIYCILPLEEVKTIQRTGELLKLMDKYRQELLKSED